MVLAHPTALAISNDILEEQNILGLTINDFKRGANKEIFKSVQLWTASETPKIETLVETVDELLEGHLATLVDAWHRNPPAPYENVFKDLSMAILRLRLRNFNEQIKELQFLLREAEENKDTESARHYKEMIKDHNRQLRELHDTGDALSLMGKRRAETKIQANI